MDIGKLTMYISDCKLIWDLESKLVTFNYKIDDIPDSFIIGIIA